MTARFAGECFLGGVLAGLGIMAAYAARTVYAVTKRGGWSDYKRIA